MQVSAKKIEWLPNNSGLLLASNWRDKRYGFIISLEYDADDKKVYRAEFGEDDSDEFDNLVDAQLWCQNWIDSWIRENAVVTPNA